MSATLADVLEAIQAQHAAEAGPAIVRLSGPGATGLASAWAEHARGAHEVAFGTLPTRATGAAWFHEGPGVRSVVDMWVAACVLRQHAWSFVLTGDATDGGHPQLGVTLNVSGDEGRGWTEVVGDWPEDVEAELEATQWDGDVARLCGLLDVLRDRDPRRAGHWGWIEVLRLGCNGRKDELFEAATQVVLPSNREELALVLAGFRITEGSPTECAAQLDLIDPSGPLGPAAEAIRTVVDGHFTDLEGLDAGLTVFECDRRWMLHQLRRPVEAAPLPGPLAAAMRGRMRGEEVDDQLLQIGDLSRAAHLTRSSAPRRVLYLAQPATQLAILQGRAFLKARDLDRLQHQVDMLDTIMVSKGVNDFRSQLLRVGLAVARGDRAGLLGAIARIAAYDGRMKVHPSWGPELLAQPIQDPWCRATLARFLQHYGSDDLRGSIDCLEDRPIAVGPYALLEPVGRGGVATVWRARHPLTDADVAVKVLDRCTPGTVERFRAEVEVVANFEHPMIVRVLDLVEIDAFVEAQSQGAVRSGQPGLVMEFVDRGTLSDHLGRLDWPSVRDVLFGLLDALAYAHAQGVVHRDVKPQNVLVGENDTLRLADFGLSRLLPGERAGTPMYMSPEQFRIGHVGPRADLYALGCLAWALVTGAPPYFGNVAQLQLAHSTPGLPVLEPIQPIPEGFGAWLETCLQVDERDRFRSAAHAAAALLKVSGPMVHGTGMRLPEASSTTTFLLPALLGRPTPNAPSTRPVPDERGELIAVFEEHRSFQSRLPTWRLLRHGDPPIVGQEAAQAELWESFLQALGGTSTQVALRGPGSRMLVRWLRKRAGRAGLTLSDRPDPGRICIFEGDELASGGERWLAVDLSPADVPGRKTIQLERLDATSMCQVVRARVQLELTTLCEVASHCLGEPRVAMAMVEDLKLIPGLRLAPEGLAVVGKKRRWRHALQAWEAIVATWSPDYRTTAQRILFYEEPCPGSILDKPVDLRRVAVDVNGAWQVPRALAATLRANTSADERQAMHAHWSRHGKGAMAQIQGCLADPSRSSTLELLERLDELPMQGALLNVSLALADRYLVPAPDLRWRARIIATPLAELKKRAMRLDDTGFEFAMMRLAMPGIRLKGAASRARALVAKARSPFRMIGLSLLVAEHLRSRGEVDEVRRLCREVQQQLQGKGPKVTSMLAYFLVRQRPDDQLEEGLTRLLFEDTPYVRAICADLSDLQMSRHDYLGALQTLEVCRGQRGFALAYNRLLCMVGLRQDAEASEILRDLTPFTRSLGLPALGNGLQLMQLFLRLEHAGPLWNLLLQGCQKVHDPMLGALLKGRLEGRGGPRAQTLRALL